MGIESMTPIAVLVHAYWSCIDKIRGKSLQTMI